MKTKLGTVKAGEVYPVPIAQGYLGMKRWAWSTAVKRGLKVKKVGRRMYVTGDELLRFFGATEPKDKCD